MQNQLKTKTSFGHREETNIVNLAIFSNRLHIFSLRALQHQTKHAISKEIKIIRWSNIFVFLGTGRKRFCPFLKTQGWYALFIRTSVADPHHFLGRRIRIRIRVKNWIVLIRLKVKSRIKPASKSKFRSFGSKKLGHGVSPWKRGGSHKRSNPLRVYTIWQWLPRI